MGSDVEMGPLINNPVIISPKGETVQLVIDARYLISNTDLSNCSWHLEPIQMLLIRRDGVYYSTSDLAWVYNQALFLEDTKKITSSVVGEKQYMLERGFLAYAIFQNFFVEPWQSLLLKWLPGSKLTHILMMLSYKQKTKMTCGKIWNLISNAWDHQGWKLTPTPPNSFRQKFNALDTLILTKEFKQLPKGPRPEKHQEP